jgi:hypothetical protein
MKQQHHLGIVTATREVTQVKALITDLYRLVDVLNVDIDFREQEAGVTDLARPEYPALARTMSARRDNLLETVSALLQRAGRSDVAI